MGLTVSHGAFDGYFHEFNNLRKAVAEAIGGSYPPHRGPTWSNREVFHPERWYWGPGYTHESHPGLSAFFSASDDQHSYPPKIARKIARELKAVEPLIASDMWRKAVRKYRKGARRAARAGEPLRHY